MSDVLVRAPEANDQAPSLSIPSYAGLIRVGVAADAGLSKAPPRLADALEREVAERAAALERGSLAGADPSGGRHTGPRVLLALDFSVQYGIDANHRGKLDMVGIG